MAKIISIHATPKSSKNVVLGRAGGEVRCKVTAPPDNGKANKALCKLIADEVGVAKSAVEVVGGHTSRHKRIAVNADDSLVESWLERLEELPS